MKIVTIGSLNIDYVYQVDDFVKPGETKAALSRSVHAGGKGLNQSIAAARAGACVWHAGVIGTEGRFLRQLLEENGVDTRHLKEENTAGGHTVIQVSATGQNSILLYGGTNRQLTREHIDAVLADCLPGDILLLQNETNLVDYAIETACEKGIQTALNASPVDSALLSYPLDKLTWLVVNELEGSAISKTSPEEKEIIQAIAKQYPNCRLVLTLGEKGVCYHDKEQDLQAAACKVDTVVDTTGAGDTFLGYFLACMTEQMPVHQALARCTAASALAIQLPGAAASIPTRAKVEQALAQNHFALI